MEWPCSVKSVAELSLSAAVTHTHPYPSLASPRLGALLYGVVSFSPPLHIPLATTLLHFERTDARSSLF